MKRITYLLLAALLVFSLCACVRENASSSKEPAEDSEAHAPSDLHPAENTVPAGVDIDLTILSSTMVYAEVCNMLYFDPYSYLGKTVKISGAFASSQMVIDEVAREQPVSYVCIISDATACCVEGIEFVLAESRAYPDEFPEPGTEITVVGRFQAHEENGITWLYLADTEMAQN